VAAMTVALDLLREHPYGWVLVWGILGWALLAAVSAVGVSYIAFLKYDLAIWRHLYLGGAPSLPRPSRVPPPPAPTVPDGLVLPPPLPAETRPTLHWTPKEQHALRNASYRRPK
jgi:hypothetical protein